MIYGIKKKIDLYDTFIEGSKESFDLVFSMFPCMLAMIFSLNIFLKSGVINYIFELLKPIVNILKIPAEVFPMMILRPISGSASLAFLNNIFETYGPDSIIGILSSVVQGSTDTTFYVLTLYFGSIGIKKIRYSLWVGLFADLIGILSAIIVVKIFF
ncbi:MAG: spore maturation protein [Bacilli bacterium]|nr:spore maturation protein [Bacilli bacterium]